jgi:hypothetical protein
MAQAQAQTPVPPAAKRSRALAFPCVDDKARKRVKSDAPVGKSKQAASKRRVLLQIQDGSFSLEKNRWEEYKCKLAELDPQFEVCDSDPRLVRSVKHSRCGSWILMRAPYHTDRFKAHVKSCSYSTAGGRMNTLAAYGVTVCPLSAFSPSVPPSAPSPSASIPSTSSSSSSLPCLGLTEKDDRRIAQYFERTCVNSAGGVGIHGIAKELFSEEFKNLTPERKDMVRQKQMQTHTWALDHQRKAVHAIGQNACEGTAILGSDGTLIPCNHCLDLLGNRAFRNAIDREPPHDDYRMFVPHVFQPAEIGKMYRLGLYELLDGVRTMVL